MKGKVIFVECEGKLHKALKIRAVRNERSLSQEVRIIIQEALGVTP